MYNPDKSTDEAAAEATDIDTLATEFATDTATTENDPFIVEDPEPVIDPLAPALNESGAPVPQRTTSPDTIEPEEAKQ